MMKALTQQELARGEHPLSITARCHPLVNPLATYKAGVVVFTCSVCGEHVTSIAVAPGPPLITSELIESLADDFAKFMGPLLEHAGVCRTCLGVIAQIGIDASRGEVPLHGLPVSEVDSRFCT